MHEEEEQTLTMMIKRAHEDSVPPKWWEVLIGTGVLAFVASIAWDILTGHEHSPDHSHLIGWTVVSVGALSGFYLVAPIRTKEILKEIRKSWRIFRGQDVSGN